MFQLASSILIVSMLALQQTDRSIVSPPIASAAAAKFVDRLEVFVVGVPPQKHAGATVIVSTDKGGQLASTTADDNGRALFENVGLNPNDGDVKVLAIVDNVGSNGGVGEWQLKPVTVQVVADIGREGAVYSTAAPAGEMEYVFAYETASRDGYEYTVCKPVAYQQPVMYQQPQFIQVYYVPVQQSNSWCPFNWF